MFGSTTGGRRLMLKDDLDATFLAIRRAVGFVGVDTYTPPNKLSQRTGIVGKAR